MKKDCIGQCHIRFPIVLPAVIVEKGKIQCLIFGINRTSLHIHTIGIIVTRGIEIKVSQQYDISHITGVSCYKALHFFITLLASLHQMINASLLQNSAFAGTVLLFKSVISIKGFLRIAFEHTSARRMSTSKSDGFNSKYMPYRESARL